MDHHVPASLPQHPMPTESRAIRWRAVAIGLVLVPLNCYWIILIECIWFSGHPTAATLFFNAVFSLCVVLSINLFLQRFIPSVALNRGELLTIYAMLCAVSVIAARQFLPLLVQLMPHAFWFAMPENEWAQTIHPYVPTWLSISNKTVLQGYYEGNSTFFTRTHLFAWLVPIFWWSLFILALLLVMLCLCIIVRKQWTENEKLAYPIVQLPLAITNKESGIFKAKLLWVGFGIAAGIDLMNGLNFFFPRVPYLHVKLTPIGHFFTDKPWSAIGWTAVAFSPFLIGMSFFLPLDLSFSLWFFFLFRKAIQVVAAVFGYPINTGSAGMPIFDQQAQGAWLGFALITVWVTRRHFAKVFRQTFHPRSEQDRAEGLGYKWAFGGMIAAMLFIFVFSYSMGMSIWVVLLFFAIDYAIFLALSRVRAEVGPPFHNLWGVSARPIMFNIFGPRRLGPFNLTAIALFHFFHRTYSSHPMPEYLENLKIGERANIRMPILVTAMVLATLIAIPTCFSSFLHLAYKFGAHMSYAGWESFNTLHQQLSYPSGTDVRAVLLMILGFFFTLILMAMRMRFLWWPFHPAGYAISINFGVDFIWFCLVISSLAKWMILKYGGLQSHRKAVPFFLGLILGEFVVGSFWSALSIVIQTPTYKFGIL